MVLSAQTNSILSLITPLAIFCVFNPTLNASFTVWQYQGANDGSQNIAAARVITCMMQIGLGSRGSNCRNRFSLTAAEQLHSAKLRSNSSQV